jgi:hypothetical protein
MLQGDSGVVVGNLEHLRGDRAGLGGAILRQSVVLQEGLELSASLGFWSSVRTSCWERMANSLV